jgi:spore coat protein U-like protein
MIGNTLQKHALAIFGAAAISLLVGGGAAFAGSAGATLGVSADVTDNCTIAASPTVSVGSYDALHGAVSATGTLTLTCTTGSVAVIALDTGANGSHATGTTRAMSDGNSDYLSYELYQNSGHTVLWGTNANAATENAATSTTPVDYTVYALVPASQDVPPGSYSDSVTVTVTF